AHEIAHQWFGDSVTESDWHHVWLSEGFATYFGALYFERAYGRDRFIQSMQGSKQRYLRAFERNPGPIHDSRISDLSDVLTGYHYVKGGWVLHMLRGIMGDTAFFNGIRDYYRTYRDENALTADFQKVMEFHGERPLDWFFQQWIYETGHPVYQLSWTWDNPKK
ncbi:MAG TPA: M1 family peptidase, partial [candidate division Zixibacteria bacterium]|nr:M1 family peptidase [candidate division Zixibacteria bacterium]